MAGDRLLPQLVARVRYDDSELRTAQKNSALTGTQLSSAITQHNAALAQHDTLTTRAAGSNVKYADTVKATVIEEQRRVAQTLSSMASLEKDAAKRNTLHGQAIQGRVNSFFAQDDNTDWQRHMDFDQMSRTPPARLQSRGDSAMYRDYISSSVNRKGGVDLINSTDPERFASDEWQKSIKARQELIQAQDKLTGSLGKTTVAHAHHNAESSKSVGILDKIFHGGGRAAHGIELLGTQLGRAGASSVGNSRLGSILSPLQSFGPVGAAAIGVGAVAGIGFLLESLVHKEGQLAVSVLETAKATRLGERDAQSYGAMLQQAGFAAGDLDKFAGHLRGQVDAGNQVLRRAGITSKDTGEAFRQAADYVSTHNDAMQNAVVLEEAFGSGGAAMLPIFRQGREFLTQYTAEMERYGAILDHDQLKTAAWQEGARAEMGLAWEGIQTRFIAPMETGFGMLELTIAKMMGNSGDAAKSFGQIVANVASFVAGVFSFIANSPINLATKDERAAQAHAAVEQHKGAVDSARSSVSSLGNAQQRAADQAQALQRQTQLATQAIQDRIQTEHDVLAATEKRLDVEQQELELRDKELAAEEALVDSRRQANDLNKKITHDTAALTRATVLGDFKAAQKAGEDLTSDKEQQADEQKKAVIKASRDELRARMDTVSRERKAAQDLAAEHTQLLEQQRQAVERTAQAQEAAMKASDAGRLASSQATAASLIQGNKDWLSDFQGMTGTMSGDWAEKGSKMAQSFHDFLWGGEHEKGNKGGISGIIPMLQDGQLLEAVKKAGGEIGKALAEGAASSFGDSITNRVKENPLDPLAFFLGGPLGLIHGYDPLTGFLHKSGGQAGGGRYSAGQAFLTSEYGPELRIEDHDGTTIPHHTLMGMRAQAQGDWQDRDQQSGQSRRPLVVNNYFPNYQGDERVIERAVEAGVSKAYRRR